VRFACLFYHGFHSKITFSSAAVGHEDGIYVLNSVYLMVETLKKRLELSKSTDSNLPPILKLRQPSTSSPDDPAFFQFENSLSWDAISVPPDPGQVKAFHKHIPVDLLQVIQISILTIST
jgi:hypothetical protein